VTHIVRLRQDGIILGGERLDRQKSDETVPGDEQQLVRQKRAGTITTGEHRVETIPGGEQLDR
jgi:hypothetical protein